MKAYSTHELTDVGKDRGADGRVDGRTDGRMDRGIDLLKEMGGRI